MTTPPGAVFSATEVIRQQLLSIVFEQYDCLLPGQENTGVQTKCAWQTCCGGCARRVWNLADGSCRAVLEGHVGRLNQVALSEDGGTALTASDDGTARLWSIPAGDCLQVALAAVQCGMHPVLYALQLCMAGAAAFVLALGCTYHRTHMRLPAAGAERPWRLCDQRNHRGGRAQGGDHQRRRAGHGVGPGHRGAAGDAAGAQRHRQRRRHDAQEQVLS
jgi:hypothetical protein